MRFREFNPKLFESTLPAEQADISAINHLEQVLKQNPEAAEEILPELQQLVDFVDSKQQPVAVDTVQQVPQKPPVQRPPIATKKPMPYDNNIGAEPKVDQQVGEAVATTVGIDGTEALEQALMLLRKLKGELPKGTSRAVNLTIKDIEDQVREVHVSGVKKGGQDILDTQANWREVELPELSKQLTFKVLGYLQTLKEISDEAIAKGEESPRNAKKPPEKNSIYVQIHDPLEALFAKLSDPKAGVDSEEYMRNINKVKDFMQRCQVGIFDIDALLRKKVGNIRSLISKDDQQIYDVIFQKLLSLTVSGGGSWGPGEIGLAVLGKPVQKQAGKGDLMVGKKKIPIELKSGADAKAGARIGGDGVVQARAATGNFLNYLNTFISGLKLPPLPSVDGRPVWVYETEKLKNKTVKGVTTRVPTGEKVRKTLFATNMSSSTWFQQFNENILAKLNPAKRKASAKTFLSTVLQMCISSKGESAYKEAIQKFNSIENMLDDKTGFIDYQKFLKEITKIWYHVYSSTDDVKYILVLNQTNGNFELVKGADELTANIGTPRDKKNPKGIEITGGLDFGAGQIQLSPQIGVY